ncbi:MAG: aldehyde ferredoxin oxidoreductase family protein [Archaeoglobaceae archaeon]
MYGWRGKILKIDLTDQNHSITEPEEEIYHKFIGGRGLAGYYLRESITLDWNDPQISILFFTGPLNNTSSPTSGRMTVASRSPLTGTVGDSSVGGSLANSIKRAGFDGIIITGKSSNPCGIEINGQEVHFTDAGHLTGRTVSQINNSLKGKGSTAVTGPAAENGVLYSGIVVDGHFFAGRNGLGLSMAVKNLKYLTVKGEEGKTEVYNPQELKAAREEIFRLAATSPALMGELGLSKFGTGALYDLMHTRRMMPTDNFRKTYFPPAPSMNAYAFKQKYQPRKAGCKGCHILCKRRTKEGQAIPEFETMSHFSALLENEDIDTVKEANSICNEAGMDTISAGATLACYAEIRGEKLSSDEIIDILQDMTWGRDEGKELAEGAYRYARSRGKPESAMTVKKQEMSAYDPRGAYGMALAYATSTRGACHLRAYPISHEILRKPVATDRFTFSGKARIIKINEDMNAVIDSLTACKFLFFGATLEEFSRAYTAVTGVPSSAQDLLRVGERVYYNERIMNYLNGFTAQDDDLPTRFFSQPGSSGNNIDIPPIDRKEFCEARARYYRIRGLDENGLPLEQKARELELEWKS